MDMHNPPHPGEFIADVYLDESGVTRADLARALNVSPSTIARLVAGKANVSPEMAIKLSHVLDQSAASWLAMQSAYDLWHARKDKKVLKGVSPIDFGHRAA